MVGLVVVALFLAVFALVASAVSSVFTAAFGSAGFVLFMAWLICLNGFEQIVSVAFMPLKAANALLGRISHVKPPDAPEVPQRACLPQDANVDQQQAAKAVLGIQ